MRINKYLADCGIGSRRKVEEYILNNQVKINDVIVNNLSTLVNPNDVVKFNNKVVEPIKEKVYIMLYKPKGYLTTVSDIYNRKTVLDLLKDKELKDYRVYPIGRLDYDTEGLLLLTNDGDFANSVIHPRNNICKTYEVEVKHPLNNFNIKELTSGMVIDGYKTTPAKLENYRKIGNKFVFNLTIFEGRNRQIRKMIEKVNNEVLFLKRISIGKLTLGKLKVGEYRYLTKDETKKIFIK